MSPLNYSSILLAGGKSKDGRLLSDALLLNTANLDAAEPKAFTIGDSGFRSSSGRSVMVEPGRVVSVVEVSDVGERVIYYDQLDN